MESESTFQSEELAPLMQGLKSVRDSVAHLQTL